MNATLSQKEVHKGKWYDLKFLKERAEAGNF